MKNVRFFEVVINNNFLFPAYTIENVTPKQAVKRATQEAKWNDNECVEVFEVDDNGNLIDNGFHSGTIKIK